MPLDKTSPEYIKQLEKSIVEKYGQSAAYDPVEDWSEDKEEQFQKQSSSLAVPEQVKFAEEHDGVLIETKLLMKERRVCSECGGYFIKLEHAMYLTKFGWCKNCFLKHEFALKNKGAIK